MTADEAIVFLRRHQPMPPDSEITDTECDMYVYLLKHFENHLDDRCIPLLINSVSSDTGMGMYEDIRFVLMAHPRKAVIPHLQTGLQYGSTGVKYRCCWWALDINAWELEPLIRPLILHEEEDVRESASAFIQLWHESRV